jgi:transcriptional regulator with XRE-family HTH domain
MAGDARLGSVLRQMRESRGISLKAAAGALGTERHATIAEIEAGKRNASFAEIVSLASLYGVTLPDVLAATSDETKPLEVAIALPRAVGSLTESDRIAIARMERVARQYASLKGVLGS